MTAFTKASPIDPLLYPKEAAKISERLHLVAGEIPTCRHRPTVCQDWTRRALSGVELTRVEPSPSTTITAEPIPMSQTPVLIETSFADAIAMILAAEELPEQTRRHWATSLRQISKAFDKPLEVIPARYSAVRADLINLHQVPAGLTAKTT
jgi:hypothetical protein